MAKEITGTLKYLENGQLVTDWGEGYFLALKFTNNDPEKIKTIKVGLNPSQGSGLVPLDEDMNGVFKITNNATQKFVVECYDEDDTKISTDEYDLSKLNCVHYVFSSEAIENGAEYESTYFTEPRIFSISGLTENDVVTAPYAAGEQGQAILSNIAFDSETGTYSATVFALNQTVDTQTLSIKVNNIVVCTVSIKGLKKIEPEVSSLEVAVGETQTIHYTSYNISDNAEYTVTSFDEQYVRATIDAENEAVTVEGVAEGGAQVVISAIDPETQTGGAGGFYVTVTAAQN